METSIHYTSNIVQDDDSCSFGEEGIEMFNESNSIFLLFTWGIKICEKEQNMVMADKSHKTSGIKLRPASLLFSTISGLVRILTLVDGRIWDFCVVGTRRPFLGVFDPLTYSIHLFL